MALTAGVTTHSSSSGCRTDGTADWSSPGAPGTRRQYATDTAISDQVLALGYAYAATDKGNSGADFYRDGKRPSDAVAEWNTRTTQLTRAAAK